MKGFPGPRSARHASKSSDTPKNDSVQTQQQHPGPGEAGEACRRSGVQRSDARRLRVRQWNAGKVPWFAPRKNMPPGAAKAQGRISFNGAQDTERQFASAIHACSSNRKKRDELIAQMLAIIAADTVPERPGRSESRARKRRPKNYQLLKKPRCLTGNLCRRNRPKTNESRTSGKTLSWCHSTLTPKAERTPQLYTGGGEGGRGRGGSGRGGERSKRYGVAFVVSMAFVALTGAVP